METLYKRDTMSKKRTMDEYRQTKDTYYKVPPSKKPELNHHDIIYSNSDIKTPAEWLSANTSYVSEPVTRSMEAYATYYVKRLIELKLI